VPVFVGMKVCTDVWDDRAATVRLPRRQNAGFYKALVPIYQTRRHTHEECNLHLKIVRTPVLPTHFGFPTHKQNCTLFQSTFPFL